MHGSYTHAKSVQYASRGQIWKRREDPASSCRVGESDLQPQGAWRTREDKPDGRRLACLGCLKLCHAIGNGATHAQLLQLPRLRVGQPAHSSCSLFGCTLAIPYFKWFSLGICLVCSVEPFMAGACHTLPASIVGKLGDRMHCKTWCCPAQTRTPLEGRHELRRGGAMALDHTQQRLCALCGARHNGDDHLQSHIFEPLFPESGSCSAAPFSPSLPAWTCSHTSMPWLDRSHHAQELPCAVKGGCTWIGLTDMGLHN